MPSEDGYTVDMVSKNDAYLGLKMYQENILHSSPA